LATVWPSIVGQERRRGFDTAYASELVAGRVKRHEGEQLLGDAGRGARGLYTHLFRESYDAVHAGLTVATASRQQTGRRRFGSPVPVAISPGAPA